MSKHIDKPIFINKLDGGDPISISLGNLIIFKNDVGLFERFLILAHRGGTCMIGRFMGYKNRFGGTKNYHINYQVVSEKEVEDLRKTFIELNWVTKELLK